ncbi:carboxypeptidase-like regulatory domain-containing protein, partial [Gilliamella sp. B3812]
FIKGQGGDINLAIKDDKGNGAKNIPVRLIYSASSKTPIFVTSNSGTVELKNTLKGHQYDMVVDAEDFIADSSNKIKYALWDATLPDSKNAYVDKISFNMAGKNQKGQFNVKPRNEWGVDGVVAIDQNGDGIYTVDFDTGAIDMNVELYYPGTTTKVLGTKTMTTTDNGRYRFKDLAVASYDIKVTNVKAPYIPISKIEQNVKITDENNQTSGPTFLLKMDPNDTTLAGISGNVFVLGPQQYIKAGPDSGKTGNNIPLATLGSTGINTTVELYQHNGTDWEKIASQLTAGNLGTYQFVGLVKNKDYKVVVTESNINLNENIFVNDTDGKSTSTSSKSKSIHKGKVTLSNGMQANIAAKEIILPKLNDQKTNQNFWYSPIRKGLGNLLVVNYLKTANGEWSWSSTINGLEAITASTYTKIVFFEEDGVTPATDLQGNKLEVSYQKPGFYGVRGSQNYSIDHAGLFYYSVVEYDKDNLDYPESYNGEYSVNVAPAKTWGDTIYFTPTRPNTISGYVYLNNSHSGTLGTYNPNQDIPIKQNRVTLEREVFGEWTVITEFATDDKGHYNFTNLPNGEYRVTAKQEYGGGSDIRNGDIDFENNDQNSGSSIDPNDNRKMISSIIVNASGGNKYNTDTNIWYKLKINQHILRGSVFLDTWLGDGEIQTEQMYNANDLPLKNAIVLLCEDDGTNDCTENGSNFIGKKLTNAKGEYSFQGQQDGINRDVTYIVKTIYPGTTAVTNPDKELAPSYKVQFKQLDMPLTKHFLMQGKGQFSGAPVNDLNGDMKYAGEQTIENGDGYFQIYFWNGSDYEKWGDIGDYYRTIKLKSLPQGKYRIVHNQGDNFIDIADMDPATPPGTLDFEVLADGSLANNLDKNNLFLMQAQVSSSNTTEAISGKLYLDVTGSKNKDEAVELTKEELIQYNKGLLTVSGIFTPRIYPGYFNGNV